MTEFYKRMLNDENGDFPAKSRERRRRRIRMKGLAETSPTGFGQPASHSGNENETESKRIRTVLETSDIPPAATSTSASSGENMEPVDPEAALRETDSAEPVYGTMSVSGRAREMEDTISVRTSLCRPEINRRRPLHFFGVYDGHGGPHVAALCREKLHVFFEWELMRVSCTTENEGGKGSTSRAEERVQEAEWEDRWRTVVARSFRKMDEVAISTCPCGSLGYRCACHSMEAALSGSTAVVAVVTSEYIIVANCGDSRAVLCRSGRAIPLSCDHKPDRPDELARIEAVGGRVIFVNGARVEGILAMSRAIGDKYLKPVVTSEPTITFTKREPEDECVILASDGLWDVLSNDLACEVASECLKEENNGGFASREDNARPRVEDEGAAALYPSRSVLAAALLTRLALGRKSSDNISVIVVDLKRSQLSNT